ncbi:MAG: hypothetical protein ACRCS9_16000 [Hyphomicrobium sp.]
MTSGQDYSPRPTTFVDRSAFHLAVFRNAQRGAPCPAVSEEAELMLKYMISAAVFSGLALGMVMTSVTPAVADGGSSYRKGTAVKGYTQRRGGYSYGYADSVNTYGDSRSLYGGSSVFRDPMLDRQTNAGPFDHGFFFDSGTGPRGGDSPYMN